MIKEFIMKFMLKTKLPNPIILFTYKTKYTNIK